MSKPTQEMFRDAARDVTAWRAKAVALRAAATALWDSFMDFFQPELTASETKIATAIQQGSARIHTSQLLYGLATETALKARIIESDPESIEFVEIKAADGSIMDVSIKKIGVSLGADGHDLIKLAEVAQILNPSNTNLFAVISDLDATREILSYLTDCVRWSGRYPAPKRFSEQYLKPSSIPGRILGLYMRDWLDPFLDSLLPTSI